MNTAETMASSLSELVICYPPSGTRTQWQSTTDLSYPQEVGLAIPDTFWSRISPRSVASPPAAAPSLSSLGQQRDPVMAVLQLDIFGITAPCAIDIYEGTPSRKEKDAYSAALKRPDAALYESCLFMLAHTERIPAMGVSSASSAAYHSSSQSSVEISFMLRPDTAYLRCLVYGASSSFNPYRICEIFNPRLGIVPERSALSFEDCMRHEHGMALLLRSAFRDVEARASSMQIKAIGMIRSIDEALTAEQNRLMGSARTYVNTASMASATAMQSDDRFDSPFDRKLHIKCLLLSDHLTYVGTWLQTALARIKIEIAKLSIRWADFAAEPVDIFGQVFIDSMQPLVLTLNQLEQTVDSLDQVSEQMIRVGDYDYYDGSSEGDSSVAIRMYVAPMPEHVRCHTCHVSRIFYPRVCCQDPKQFSGCVGVVEVSVLDSYLVSSDLMTPRDVVTEYYLRRYKPSRTLYQRYLSSVSDSYPQDGCLIPSGAHGWLENDVSIASSEIAASIKCFTNSRASKQLRGADVSHIINGKVTINTESEGDLPWNESNIDSGGESAKPLSVISLLPAAENSIAESLFIQIWGPDLLPMKRDSSGSVTLLCKCSYLIEWFVKSSKELKRGEKPFVFRYFLETHRFHNFVVSLIGVENATALLEPVDAVDNARRQQRLTIVESLLSMMSQHLIAGAIDGSGVCVCVSILTSNTLLLGDVDLFFKSMKTIKALHRNDGLERNSIRMHEVDYSCLVYSLVLCIVAAIVGATKLNSQMMDNSSAVLQNVRNMIAKLAMTPHIGNGFMSFILMGITRSCLTLCNGLAHSLSSYEQEGVPCCTIAAIIEVCAEAINDLIAEPKEVVQFDDKVTTNAFPPGTYLSFDNIRSLVEMLEPVGNIPSIEDVRRKMISKLNLSVEVVNNFFNPPDPPSDEVVAPASEPEVVVADTTDSDKCDPVVETAPVAAVEEAVVTIAPTEEAMVVETKEEDKEAIAAESIEAKSAAEPISQIDIDSELLASDELSELEALMLSSRVNEKIENSDIISSFAPPSPIAEKSVPEPQAASEDTNAANESESANAATVWDMEPDELIEVQPEFYEPHLIVDEGVKYMPEEAGAPAIEPEPNADAESPPLDEVQGGEAEDAHIQGEADASKEEQQEEADADAPQDEAVEQEEETALVDSSDEDGESQSNVMRSIALAKIMADRMEAERIQLRQKRMVDIQHRIEQDKERALMEKEDRRMRELIRTEKARQQLSVAESRIAKVREQKIKEYERRLEEQERLWMEAEEKWQRANEAWMARQRQKGKKAKQQPANSAGHDANTHSASDAKNSTDSKENHPKQEALHSDGAQNKSSHAAAGPPDASRPDHENKPSNGATPSAASTQIATPAPKPNEVKTEANDKQPASSSGKSKEKKDGCAIS